MERTSLLYKLRRKAQVGAHILLPDEALSKIYYRIVLKKKLDLADPQTFNEKLQWMKLYFYPNDPLVVQCADKYAVRQYVKEKGYEELLVPLIGCWENVADIAWDMLPDKFVLKCNHGCAYNILCSDKRTFDTAGAVKQLNSWMKEDFGAFNVELHYSKIKKHLITCEEHLGDNITDYKFFCFNGEPAFLYVSSDLVHDRSAKIGFFNLDGSKMQLKRDDYADIESFELPSFFDEMVSASRELSRGFPFVRVDFFIANGRYYFAELTFTPSACMMPFNPERFDLEWGRMIDLEGIKGAKR